MGLFSKLKRGGDEQEWMDDLLSEVGSVQLRSDPELEAPAESWNFPDELEFELAETAPPASFEPGTATEAHVLESILPATLSTNHTERRAPEPDALAFSVDETPLLAVPDALLTPAASLNGPTGTKAGELLASFGLSTGASWPEVRSAYLDLKSSCDPILAMNPGDADRFREVLTDANSAYAALRLTAVRG